MASCLENGYKAMPANLAPPATEKGNKSNPLPREQSANAYA